MKKVVLAYSGGLDTSCCVNWLKGRGFKVICFSANLGSEFSPYDLKTRAVKSGADKIYIKDLKKEFAYDYILPALCANAVYEGKYVLSTALGRPLIAKYLVEVAKKEKAAFVAHGSTAKGNDQVRLELSIRILSPRLKIIAPLREWDLASREDEIEYAKKNKIPIKASRSKIYSIDQNIWGVSIEGGNLEDLNKEPVLNSYVFVKPLKSSLNKEVYIDIEFLKGVPYKINSQKMDLVSIIEKLNKLGASCGIGRTDLIEDRVIGIKSREVYEAPAAWILHTAHRELESLTLDKETLALKEFISSKYAQLVYQGLWFSEAKKSLDAFIEKAQEKACGAIGLKLYKGNIVIVKRSSPYALYAKKLATYGKDDKFDRNLSEGFIKLFGLPYRQF